MAKASSWPTDMRIPFRLHALTLPLSRSDRAAATQRPTPEGATGAYDDGAAAAIQTGARTRE